MSKVQRAADRYADTWRIKLHSDSPLDSMTGEIAIEEAFLAGAAWQRERDAEICNRERMRQIKGERLEKMNGADTAFALMKTIRESFDENKDG